MEEEKKEPGFVVRDKRHFDDEGNVRPEESPAFSHEEPDEPAAKESPRPEPDLNDQKPPEGDYPEVDFIGFILSLSTTAMYHFGDIPDPYTQKREKNLAAAKQTIDILSILQEKTRGNLDEQEKELLEEALYELRMRFIKEQGKP
jgi:hypothetical protein